MLDISVFLVYWLSYNQLKNTKYGYEWETNVSSVRHQEHKCNFESFFHAHVSKNKMICSYYYWRIKMVNLCKRCLPFQNHVPKLHRHQHYIIVCMENCSTFVLYIWVYVERFMVEENLRFNVCVWMLLIKCRVFAGLLAFKSSMNLLSTNSNLNQIIPALTIWLKMILIEKE